MGVCTEGTLRGRDPSTFVRIAEIKSGRAITQLGLTTTSEDPMCIGDNLRQREGFGLAHESVGAMKEG